MEAKGMVIGLIDVPEPHTQDYNRWYDFDHLPEFVSLPEVTLGRRYVALPEYRALRPPAGVPELADGKGAYCTTYVLGSSDFESAQKSWKERADYLYKERRIFRHGKIADVGFFKLEQTHLRSDIPVAPEAVPYLGHSGIMVVLTEVADPSKREAVNEWFREMHGPDLLTVHGIIAAMRFSRVDREPGRFVNVYLLEGDPIETKRDLDRRVPEMEAKGRSPSPDRASRILLQSVYRSIVPTQYDFRVD